MTAELDAFSFDLPPSSSGSDLPVAYDGTAAPPGKKCNKTYMIKGLGMTYVNALDQKAHLESPAECSEKLHPV